MSVKYARLTREKAQEILERYQEFIQEIFPDYIIGGSYSRGCETVGDIDIVCDIDKAKHKLIRNKIKHIGYKHAMIYTFVLDELKFSVHCVKEQFISSSIFLIKGPDSRCDEVWKKAEDKGFYMTHFGLLPIEKEIPFKQRDEECYNSDKKIIFKTEQEYYNFIYN